MERVIFVVEATGERIACQLNPEGLEFRRESGVRTRRSAGGGVSGLGRGHDPMLATGGGRTELDLDLLFDLDVDSETLVAEDVRQLTERLWALAEGRHDGPPDLPPVLRFIWGRAWNVPGVIVALSERLDRFRSDGVPTRSWLRLRIVAVDEPTARRVRAVRADGTLPPTPPTSTPPLKLAEG